MKTIEIVYYNNEKPQFAESSKFQEIPETWEELKELVKIYSGKINKDVIGYTIGERAITIVLDGINLHFGKDGIYLDDKLYKLTPQQMWEIIKNLMEDK